MMHKMFILLALCLTGVSCRDPHISENPVKCIEEIIYNANGQILPEPTIATIKSLFEFNKMSLENLSFYDYSVDDLGLTHAKAYQYANGLRIFTGNVGFHFQKDQTSYFLSGKRIDRVTLNAKSSLKKDQVASLFLSEIKKEPYSGIDKEAIIGGCIEVEFGYYNLNAGSGTAPENMVKAWKVTAKGLRYPFAYINDDTSGLIYYDNGIRTITGGQ